MKEAPKCLVVTPLVVKFPLKVPVHKQCSEYRQLCAAFKVSGQPNAAFKVKDKKHK